MPLDGLLISQSNHLLLSDYKDRENIFRIRCSREAMQADSCNIFSHYRAGDIKRYHRLRTVISLVSGFP